MTENKQIVWLSSGDQHFGKEDNDRLFKELDHEFLQGILELKENGMLPNVIFLDGDLYHRIIRFNERSGILVIKFMENLLEICKNNQIQLRIIRGTKSHDFNQLDMLRKYETQYYPIFKIYDSVGSEEIPLLNYDDGQTTLKTLFLPEEYPKDAQAYYKDWFSDTYDTVQGHGMIDFVNIAQGQDKSDFETQIKSAPIFSADQLCSISRGPIEFGHIHNYDSYKDKIHYTSSFTRYSFSDKGDKGYLLTTMDPTDRTSFQVSRIINEMAPTYATINIDTEEFDSAEAKVKYIQEAKNSYDHVRIVSSDPEDAKIIKKIVEHDPDVKVKIKNKHMEETKVDDKYKFLLDPANKNTTAENIQQFIKVEFDQELPLDIIEEIVNSQKQLDVGKIQILAKKEKKNSEPEE